MPEGLTLKIDPRKVAKLTGTKDAQTMITIVAQETESQMKSFAPVRTGNLRRSITHRVFIDGKSWAALVGTNVKYAIFQEYGTRFHPAHPFMRPAIEAIRRKYS